MNTENMNFKTNSHFMVPDTMTVIMVIIVAMIISHNDNNNNDYVDDNLKIDYDTTSNDDYDIKRDSHYNYDNIHYNKNYSNYD